MEFSGALALFSCPVLLEVSDAPVKGPWALFSCSIVVVEVSGASVIFTLLFILVLRGTFDFLVSRSDAAASTKAMKGLSSLFSETWGDEESRRSFGGVLVSIA